MEYDVDKVRSTRKYLNFTVKKRTEDIPQKNMMAVPIVREENAFEYVTIGIYNNLWRACLLRSVHNPQLFRPHTKALFGFYKTGYQIMFL